ncbi:protein of unknown function DUF990 [Syntrophobotulus glycolicus DSM 8271]|uniref:ABC transporter permease n=1 Tax=Syntrophobotulus glycolicus (strain DSM 8271 / FlGlyR) TaxID=645991 RepID=F0T2G3_SYNGF|nr:ABC-2 family transporter protein [Syntrophobotulus glycolicus]ADY55281.1 protein of unknown function DUF990 [Syntrophobotulus glycolicus DSM 8271]
MLHLLKLYGLHIFYFIKADSQYKANFISGIFANFYTYVLMYLSIWILTHRFPTIAGWNYQELVFLMALNLFSYAVATTVLWKHYALLEEHINNGNFDKFLIRPLAPLVNLLFHGFDWTGSGQIVASGIFLGISLWKLGLDWTAHKVGVLLVCLAGGILIQAGAMIIFPALSFWLKKSRNLGEVLFFTLRNFINYPLSIFGGGVAFILTYLLPWGFINYYPALYILNKPGEQSGFYLYTPLVGLLLFLLSLGLTNRGIARYKGVGS